jgi:hypothetical protein
MVTSPPVFQNYPVLNTIPDLVFYYQNVPPITFLLDLILTCLAFGFLMREAAKRAKFQEKFGGILGVIMGFAVTYATHSAGFKLLDHWATAFLTMIVCGVAAYALTAPWVNKALAVAIGIFTAFFTEGLFAGAHYAKWASPWFTLIALLGVVLGLIGGIGAAFARRPEPTAEEEEGEEEEQPQPAPSPAPAPQPAPTPKPTQTQQAQPPPARPSAPMPPSKAQQQQFLDDLKAAVATLVAAAQKLWDVSYFQKMDEDIRDTMAQAAADTKTLGTQFQKLQVRDIEKARTYALKAARTTCVVAQQAAKAFILWDVTEPARTASDAYNEAHPLVKTWRDNYAQAFIAKLARISGEVESIARVIENIPNAGSAPPSQATPKPSRIIADIKAEANSLAKSARVIGNALIAASLLGTRLVTAQNAADNAERLANVCARATDIASVVNAAVEVGRSTFIAIQEAAAAKGMPSALQASHDAADALDAAQNIATNWQDALAQDFIAKLQTLTQKARNVASAIVT